jgi:hypothetical protein
VVDSAAVVAAVAGASPAGNNDLGGRSYLRASGFARRRIAC